MLDQKVFLQGINYLKANYLNWGFDINNDLMIKVWYKKFSNLDANIFMNLVEKYTQFNRFPPNSPADLLELLRNELTQKELDANEAWAKVIRLIQQYGFYWHKAEIYQALETYPALKKTVEQFESELRNMRVGDSYLADRFKKAYEVNLNRQVENNSYALLGTKITLFIE